MMSAKTFSSQRDDTAECYAAITRELDFDALREDALPTASAIVARPPRPSAQRRRLEGDA
ncbi:MAG TPA: hypothetical protein VHE79_02860 [Spirochaetia bacterium]